MKEMDILRAMNDIDDKYIEEAAPGKTEKKPFFRRYYRQLTAGVGVFAVLLFGFVWLRISDFRMGSSASGDSVEYSAAQTTEEEKSADSAAETITMGTASEFIYPESYLDYTVVTTEEAEAGLTVVYCNEQGKEGMRITIGRSVGNINGTTFAQSQETAEEVAEPAGTEADNAAEETMTEAVWFDEEYTYHIILAEEISAEEMQELMNEVHR